MTTFHVLSPWHAARAARVTAGPSMDGSRSACPAGAAALPRTSSSYPRACARRRPNPRRCHLRLGQARQNIEIQADHHVAPEPPCHIRRGMRQLSSDTPPSSQPDRYISDHHYLRVNENAAPTLCHCRTMYSSRSKLRKHFRKCSDAEFFRLASMMPKVRASATLKPAISGSRSSTSSP
jgi:hypothetical protein